MKQPGIHPRAAWACRPCVPRSDRDGSAAAALGRTAPLAPVECSCRGLAGGQGDRVTELRPEVGSWPGCMGPVAAWAWGRGAMGTSRGPGACGRGWRAGCGLGACCTAGQGNKASYACSWPGMPNGRGPARHRASYAPAKGPRGRCWRRGSCPPLASLAVALGLQRTAPRRLKWLNGALIGPLGVS